MADRIGFIGVGRIGFPVARNLAAAGHDVVAFDQRPRDDYVAELKKRGARVVDDPADAVADSDFVVTLLPDSSAVEEVITSPSVRSNVRSSMVWIDMSSGFPADTRRLADHLATDHGIEMVDAPICDGGVPGAYQARLTLCVGGSEAAVERVRPVLDAVANDIVHVGPIAAGHSVKLLSNFVAHGVNGLMSELYAIALASGFETQEISDVLRRCVAARFVNLDNVDQAVLSTPPPGEPAQFRLSLARKDLRYLATEAAALGVYSPIAQGAHALYLVAERTGFADEEGTRGPLMALRTMTANPPTR